MTIFSSILYWSKSVFWSLIVKSFITWLNIKTFSTSHYVFSLRWLVQVVFSRLNCHHFFFFRLNYHSDFYDSLKSLYVHQVIENHLIDDWNFLICLSVYSYISASVIIFIVRVYINLYLFLRFFFMSQRICTRCAHNHLIHDFFDSNSTRVLNLCSSLFIDLPVYSYTLYASYILHSTC